MMWSIQCKLKVVPQKGYILQIRSHPAVVQTWARYFKEDADQSVADPRSVTQRGGKDDMGMNGG